MAFIRLTLCRNGEPASVRHDSLFAVVPSEEGGAYAHVGQSGWALRVTESPDAILAAIAEAEGAPADDAITDAMVEAAYDAYQASVFADGPCTLAEARVIIEAALRARRQP
jgi:hypothetical protein